jgi:hypothetical protein
MSLAPGWLAGMKCPSRLPSSLLSLPVLRCFRKSNGAECLLADASQHSVSKGRLTNCLRSPKCDPNCCQVNHCRNLWQDSCVTRVTCPREHARTHAHAVNVPCTSSCSSVASNLPCSPTPRYNFSSMFYPKRCWCIIQIIDSL